MLRFATRLALASASITLALLAAPLAAQHAAPAPAPGTPGSGQKAPLPPALNPETDKPGLPVGSKAPDAILHDIVGEEVALRNIYADGPVVVVFYRGGWCPFCNKALANWQSHMSELEAAGATLIAISPETTEHMLETAEKSALECMTLVDSNGEAMRRFRVAFQLSPEDQKRYKGFGVDLPKKNATKNWELPAPATFVIDQKGVIRWMHADWDYKKRAEPADVLRALKAL